MGNVLYCGLDVDDKAFHAFLINETGEFYEFSCRPNLKSLIDKLLKFNKPDIKIYYEATYLGFSLCRSLRSEGYQCEVVAPNLIPEMAGARIKTDRKDAQKLATYAMKDLLTIVHVPTEEDEHERDLTRSRSFIQDQLKMLKNHIQSNLRRAGINYKEENEKKNYWTDDYLKWLQGKVASLPEGALKTNTTMLLTYYYQQKELIKNYDFELKKLCESEKYSARVQALQCYRGIAELSAITIVTEIGDIRRFPHPRKLMSYLGFDVAEYSSGGREKKFGITKAGNSKVRRLLVEATQRCNLPPKVHYGLTTRRSKVAMESIAIADRCMNRLYKKSWGLDQRGKNRNKVKVACAREMVAFIWESLNSVAA